MGYHQDSSQDATGQECSPRSEPGVKQQLPGRQSKEQDRSEVRNKAEVRISSSQLHCIGMGARKGTTRQCIVEHSPFN